jgi:hypothetical protein
MGALDMGSGAFPTEVPVQVEAAEVPGPSTLRDVRLME